MSHRPDESPHTDKSTLISEVSPEQEGRWRRRLIGLILGAGFSLLCFYYIGKKVDLAELRAEAQDLRLISLLPASLCVALSIAIRGYRWGLMLPRNHLDRPWLAILPSSIALAINGLLPGKAGELSRIVYARFVFKLPLVSATASVLAERIADLGALSIILALALLAMGPEITLPATGLPAGITLSAFLIGLAIPALIVLRWRRAVPVEGAPESNREGEARPLDVLERLLLAVQPMRSGRILVSVIVFSLLGWGFLVLTNVFVAKGFDSLSLSLLDIMALTSISIIASALPSLPGAWGVFEGSILAVAPVLGIVASDAELISFGLATHLVQYSMVLAMGGVSGICDTMIRR